MAVRLPPKVQENLPQSLNKKIGSINNLQGRTRSLTTSIKNIHNINDALNALDELKPSRSNNNIKNSQTRHC